MIFEVKMLVFVESFDKRGINFQIFFLTKSVGAKTTLKSMGAEAPTHCTHTNVYHFN